MTQPSTQSLAIEFAQEVRHRRRDRALKQVRLMGFVVIVLMVGASFIEVQDVRRWIGVGLLGVLLAIKGYTSWKQWKGAEGGV